MYDINWTDLNWHDRYGMVWLQFIVSHHPVIRSMRLDSVPAASIQVQVALGTTSSRREIRTEQPGKPVFSQGFSPGVFARISRISKDPKFDFKMLQVGLKLSSGDFDQNLWNPGTRPRHPQMFDPFDFVWFRLISFDSQDSFEPASVFPSFHPPRSVVRNFLGAHLETSAQGQWHGWRKNGGAISEEIAGRSCMTWTWKKKTSRCTIRARCH